MRLGLGKKNDYRTAKGDHCGPDESRSEWEGRFVKGGVKEDIKVPAYKKSSKRPGAQ